MAEVRGEGIGFKPKASPPQFSAHSASSASSRFPAGYLGATTVEAL